MKAIILARVSTKEQQEEGQSIPAQVRRVTEYALKKEFQVAHTFQIAESSNKDTRKQFDQIIALINKSKEPIALIVDTVDRLQRSFRETPILDKLRKEGKLELHFLRENLIVSQNANSAQLMLWDMCVIFASNYVRQLSDNVKRSKEQCIRNGTWSSKAPFGYKNITLLSGRKSIIIDQDKAPYVIKMFELYATGLHSFQTVANEMDRLGIKNAYGRQILPSRIEVTLKNPFYYGTMRIKGNLYSHTYPPLISENLFQKVQRIMQGHNKAPVQYAGKPILLRGLMTCKQCGCTITGDIKKEKYVYYSCANSKKICKKIWVREEQLLETLLKYLDHIELTDDQVQEVATHLKQAYTQEQEFFKHAQQTLRTKLDHIQNRLSRLIDMHLDGSIDQETYRIKLNEYKQQQREVTEEMQSHVDGDESCLITAQIVFGLAKHAKLLFESSNLIEKQHLLRFLYSNLTLDAGKLLVELKEPFHSMAQIKNRPEWLGWKDSNLRITGPKPVALPLGYTPVKTIEKILINTTESKSDYFHM